MAPPGKKSANPDNNGVPLTPTPKRMNINGKARAQATMPQAKIRNKLGYFVPIHLPDGIELDIGLVLHRETNTTNKRCLESLAQMVDWWDASLTDKELERALFMLGEREELSQPLGKEGFPIGMLMSEKPYHRERKSDGFSDTSLNWPTRLATHQNY